MNFYEAEQARKTADAQKQKGGLTGDQYTAAITAIRVQDARGCWWQPDSCGPGWLCWDGKAWVTGTPPAAGSVGVAGLAAPHATGSGSTGPAPAGGSGTAQPAAGTGPAPKKPEEYTFRPVADTEPGWKLMSIAEFRAILKTTSWRKRPRKWWDLFSILLGCTLAIAWFLYSSLNPWSEGWDLITPALMIAIPVILVCCRKPIDNLLVPLQPHRAKFPHLLLLGIGICVPFLTAWILYNIVHIDEYDLIRYNMVLGTCIAYAITRDPVLATGYTQPPRSLKAPVAALIGVTFLIQAVRGDDCASSIMNANDCLRTDGYSETIAGTASAAEAGANAAGDEASDPAHQKELKDWLDTLEPNTWNKRGGTEYMVDDNGIVRVRPAQDGSSTTPADDSSSTDRLPAGTYESTVVNEDGSTTTTTTFPDNKTMTTTTSADGNTHTTTTTYPDGTTKMDQTTHNPDGSTTSTTTSTDGSQSTTVSDGKGNTVTKETDGSVTVRNRDGTSSNTTTYDDGSTMTTHDDGRTVMQEPDGTTTTTVTNPDGSKTVTTDNPDGTTESHTTGGPEEPGGDTGEGGIGGDDTSGSGDGSPGLGEQK